MMNAPALLSISDLSKSFGGVTATNHVSLDVLKGETHAIIGPNGAGKTTLISQLAGDLAPNAGTIRFAGRNITALPAYRRCQLGLARSFQITSVFMGLSVLENVALGVQAHEGHSFRFWRPAARDETLTAPAMALLVLVSLEKRARDLASALSHGERRQLEIAMALTGRPQLLLLDEPMAGMGPEESARMVGTLQRLKKSHTVLLIEHDMDAVFTLADRISVLVYGRLIATGTPEEIRHDAAVQAAYLGDGDD